MRRSILLVAVSASLFAGTEDDKIVLDPFSDSDPKGEYQPIEWPNVDIPIFVLAVGGFWVQRQQWPTSVDEVGDGFALWAATSDASEEDKKKVKEKIDLSKSFKIVETIPMRRGVAYRIIYTKRGFSFPGLIVLSEGTTPEEVAKSAQYSEDIARIVYAVPF